MVRLREVNGQALLMVQVVGGIQVPDSASYDFSHTNLDNDVRMDVT